MNDVSPVSVQLPDESVNGLSPQQFVQAYLKVSDAVDLFRIEGMKVSVKIVSREKHPSSGRLYPAAAHVEVNQGLVKYWLCFYGDEVLLREIAVTETEQSKGIGATVFAAIAGKLSRAGFKQVATNAARNLTQINGKVIDDFGYNALPKWGFDGAVPKTTQDDLPPSHQSINSIRRLIQDEHGASLWEKHGRTCDVVFDLAEDSVSWQMLNQHLSKPRYAKDSE